MRFIESNNPGAPTAPVHWLALKAVFPLEVKLAQIPDQLTLLRIMARADLGPKERFYCWAAHPVIKDMRDCYLLTVWDGELRKLPQAAGLYIPDGRAEPSWLQIYRLGAKQYARTSSFFFGLIAFMICFFAGMITAGNLHTPYSGNEMLGALALIFGIPFALANIYRMRRRATLLHQVVA